MKTIWLCWYVSGMLTLLFALTLFISFVPDAETTVGLMQAIFGCGAAGFLMLGLFLKRLPGDHWAHRSRPLWIGLVAAAVTVTF